MENKINMEITKKVKIKSIEDVTANEVMSAERAVVDNDAGIVILWEI